MDLPTPNESGAEKKIPLPLGNIAEKDVNQISAKTIFHFFRFGKPT
jgi:hypothetical protein